MSTKDGLCQGVEPCEEPDWRLARSASAASSIAAIRRCSSIGGSTNLYFIEMAIVDVIDVCACCNPRHIFAITVSLEIDEHQVARIKYVWLASTPRPEMLQTCNRLVLADACGLSTPH